MKSIVSVRGQTVVPKEIRNALGIKPGTKIIWSVQDGSAVVRAMPDDPIGAMRGAFKDLPFSTADLLAERGADRDREEAKVEALLKRWRASR